jgi:hypothetical protein
MPYMMKTKMLQLPILHSPGFPECSLMKSSQSMVPALSIITFSKVSSLETHSLLFNSMSCLITNHCHHLTYARNTHSLTLIVHLPTSFIVPPFLVVNILTGIQNMGASRHGTCLIAASLSLPAASDYAKSSGASIPAKR